MPLSDYVGIVWRDKYQFNTLNLPIPLAKMFNLAAQA